jgi:dolichyl-phosphate beta-glucosyltransferase
MDDTIVVIPCYNEADRLDVAAFEDFARTRSNARLLFVDDGSTDATAAVLARLADAHPRRLLVRGLPHNRGKAEAVRQGLLEAFAYGPTYVGYWDADLATPLPAIAALRSVLEQKPDRHVVMGSRVALLGRRIERSAVRHYLGRVFATAASLVLRLPVYDTQCGAKMFRVSAAVRAVFAEPFLSRWIFDVEILARLPAQFGAADVVYEQPLDRWVDVAGSKLRPRHFLLAAGDLLRIWRRYGSRRAEPAAGLAFDRPDAAAEQRAA